MQKYLFLIVFVVLVIPSVAQRFDAGMVAGMVGSQLDGDHKSGYHKLGFDVGAFVKTKFKNNFSGQLEIKFFQKGSFGKDSISYYKSRLNYIDVSVHLQYLYKEKYIGELGIASAYLINAKEDVDGYGLVKASPSFNNFELSGIAGIGYKFSEKISVSLRFIYSMLPVRADYSGAIRYIDRGQYNNVLSLNLFYKF